MLRVLGSIVLALAAALALVGCTGESPDPSPTATGLFATDEEAFAAAEATYRAYVDALNAVDLSDPETFEAVYAWTTGDAHAADRENLSRMHADRWQVNGNTEVVALDGVRFANDEVEAVVCLDVSEVTLLDGEGADMVPLDRPSRSAYDVRFAPAKTSTGLVVENITTRSASCEG